MEALNLIAVLGIWWFLSWLIVRWLIIPAVEAIWHVELPFWPVWALYVALTCIF